MRFDCMHVIALKTSMASYEKIVNLNAITISNQNYHWI